MKRYGNHVEGISKNKILKQGYSFFLDYWTNKTSQQYIISQLNLEDYVYTQKKDRTGLWHVVIYRRTDDKQGFS